MTDTIGLEPLPADLHSPWIINMESPEVDFLRDTYRDISSEEFDRTLISASRILGHCPNPSLKRHKSTGLAIGKIQSGKTLSFTALIALAAANGYSRIIVLSGTKNALKNQTFERLKRDLGVGGPVRASRLYVYCNPDMGQVIGVGNAIRSGKCALFAILKHRKHIENVANLLSSPEISPGPTLIIDDEGDEASLNAYFRSGEQSATHRSILRLRESLPLHAYVAYTATPQANLLLDGIDSLSPDFCELIEPGSGYCGGSVFFGEQINNFVRGIEDIDDSSSSAPPETLKQSLALFFAGAAIRHIRSEGQRHSMLIHMSRLKAEHKRILQMVKQLLTDWAAQLSLRESDPCRHDLLKLFKSAYDDLCTTVKFIPPWKDVEKRLQQELRSYEPHMVNSLPQGIQIAETTFQLENNIVIGGNILGRGLTIKDLTVSYMTRRATQSTQVDTMEQRARWFGYKREYLDLCRIYLPRRVIDDFQSILMHEDDFWDSLRRNAAQGIHVRDWPRFFRLESGTLLIPTRPSVARYYEFRPGGWEMQNLPITDSSVVKTNVEEIDRFFSSHKEHKMGKIGETDNSQHTIIENCPIEHVIELLHRIKTDKTDWDSGYYSEYLKRLLIDDRLRNIDLVWINKNNPAGFWRDRSLVQGGRINNLMEGRRAKYLGDRYIHNNKVQLQFHFIVCTKEKGGPELMRTTALAIYVPEDERFDMSYIVRGEQHEQP